MDLGGEAPERDPRAQEPARAFEEPASWAVGSVHERRELPHMFQGSAPQGGEWSPEQQAKLELLFEQALAGELPRSRELKYWEPARLSPRHLMMVMMRASGVHQRIVAKAFGAEDAHVSVIMGHPDAEYLMPKIATIRAMQTTDIAKRLEKLSEPALNAIEAALTDDDPEVMKVAMRRAPLAFKVLEINGHAKKPASELNVKHTVRLEATGEQMKALKGALLESKEIKDVSYVEIKEKEGLEEILAGPQGLSLAPQGEGNPPETQLGLFGGRE